MDNRTTIMIALLAVMMITVPSASADVTAFSVTADTTVAGATSNYAVQLNTTGLTSLSVTIPAGYEAVEPTSGGQLVARVDLWGSDPGDTASVTFTANSTNPSTKMDVSLNVSDDPTTYTLTQTISYSEGASMVIKSPKGGQKEMMNLTLPTATANGGLKLYDLTGDIQNMTVVLYLVKNPTTAGTYTFETDDGKTADVNITEARIPGDANGDTNVNIQDAVLLFNWVSFPSDRGTKYVLQ